MTRQTLGAIRLQEPKEDTTIIKARVTTLEKFQFEDFGKAYNIKLSDLLRRNR